MFSDPEAALRLAAALLLTVAVAGCSPPKAVRTYEFIDTYERMTDEYDPMVSLVYVPKPTSWAQYRGIAIGHVDVGHELVTCPEEALCYATFFRLALRHALLEQGQFQSVTMDPDLLDVPQPQRDHFLLFEGMVTKLDFGSGPKRYLSFFLWFLQSGATDFQIEGRLTNAGSGAVVAEFADRRRDLCNTPFGPNPKTLNADYAMRQTAKTTADCLAQFIALGFEGLPAAMAEGESPVAANKT